MNSSEVGTYVSVCRLLWMCIKHESEVWTYLLWMCIKHESEVGTYVSVRHFLWMCIKHESELGTYVNVYKT